MNAQTALIVNKQNVETLSYMLANKHKRKIKLIFFIRIAKDIFMI